MSKKNWPRGGYLGGTFNPGLPFCDDAEEDKPTRALHWWDPYDDNLRGDVANNVGCGMTLDDCGKVQATRTPDNVTCPACKSYINVRTSEPTRAQLIGMVAALREQTNLLVKQLKTVGTELNIYERSGLAAESRSLCEKSLELIKDTSFDAVEVGPYRDTWQDGFDMSWRKK